jgi:LPS-assembly protein
MRVRPRLFAEKLPRAPLARVLGGFLLAFALSVPAQASLLPPGFFDMDIKPGQGAAAVEADRLTYDGATTVISAEGNAMLSYNGMTIRADRLTYNQTTGEMHAFGNVAVRDDKGNVYEMDQVEVTDEVKEAFLKSMTLTTPTGAIITATDVHYQEELTTILTEASYSPCGLCIDSKGRRIGWKVKSARLIYDRANAAVILEGPSVELLGFPVAWLPWFWVPDPTQPRATGLRMPSVDYSETRGAQLTVPFFVPMGEDIDILLSPSLMSRQGFLAAGELTWRLPEFNGVIDVKASGIYQLDPSAYAGLPGDRDWRGAIQTSGRFVPMEDWTVGWSYAAFTDNAYLVDYGLTEADNSVNQVYANYLTGPTWIDARIQRFNRLGNYPSSADDQQGMNIPKIEFEHVQDLDPGLGRLHLTGELLGVHRLTDQTGTYNAVPYAFGYEGTKLHGMVEGAWENQYILPGGIAATPYLGARLDISSYDGYLAPATPPDSFLFAATPIAALDVRYPLMAFNGADSHLFEPIAQLVYRGSGTSLVGTTNDDAHSFVFDTSNLFSYNRFTGIDRQETGLRANIGGHYLGSFEDGSWLDLVAGQSFHLAGVNGLGVSDHVQVGTHTGLGTPASFIVGSARGGFDNGFSGGVKVQVDPSAWKITRAGVGVSYAPPEWFSLGMDYIYVSADPLLGVVSDQHEVAGRASVTMWDYYTLSGGLTWNIATNTWIKANTGVGYDDGYLAGGASLNFTPSSWGFGFSFNLKGPDGQIAF